MALTYARSRCRLAVKKLTSSVLFVCYDIRHLIKRDAVENALLSLDREMECNSIKSIASI